MKKLLLILAFLLVTTKGYCLDISRFSALPSCVLAESLSSIEDLERDGWTVSGNPTIANTARGKAIDFDGTGDYVTGIDDPIGVGADSACAYIRPEGWGEGNLGRIVDNGKFLFTVFNNGSILGSSNGGGNTFNSTAGSIVLNSWHHVCFTRDSAGTSGKLYVNGSQNGATANSGTPAAGTTNLNVGSDNAGNGDFNGRIQDLLIFNRVLSATEISQIYNDTVFDYWEDEVSHWDMSETNNQDTGWKGTGNDLTSNGLSAATDIVYSNGDWVIELNGFDEGTYGTDPIPASGDFTFVVNMLSYAPLDAQATLLGNMNWGTNVSGFGVRRGGNALQLVIGNNASYCETSIEANFFNNNLKKWYSLVVGYDESDTLGYSYLNGVAGTTCDKNYVDTGAFKIGYSQLNASTSYWNGMIGDIKLYNALLTQLQAEDLYIQEGR